MRTHRVKWINVTRKYDLSKKYQYTYQENHYLGFKSRDPGNIIFDKPNNESFKSTTESIQYKAHIAKTGAIQVISRERLYRELDLESLSDRRRFRKLTFFYKNTKAFSPRYLSKYVKLRSNSSYQTISAKRNKLPETNYHIELKALSIFFSIFVGEWNKFDSTIQDVESIK